MLVFDPIIDLLVSLAGAEVPGIVALLEQDTQKFLLARPIVALKTNLLVEAV